jgi:hypothetical protein
MNEVLERKLKRERVEACLNCKKFARCDDIGKFEECADYDEVENEKMIVIVKLSEYCRMKKLEKARALDRLKL